MEWVNLLVVLISGVVIGISLSVVLFVRNERKKR